MCKDSHSNRLFVRNADIECQNCIDVLTRALGAVGGVASERKEGNTAVALNVIAKTLEAEGVGAETFWIGGKPVRGCMACGKCREGGGKCVFGDDAANDLAAKMASADAVVVGSPVYYGQPNGALLALLQRALFSNPDSVHGKPVATVAICRRGGAGPRRRGSPPTCERSSAAKWNGRPGWKMVYFYM